MLHFEGDKEIRLSPEEVTAKLGDARFLSQCIPGVESVAEAEPRRAAWKLRPGFSFVRGTLDIALSVTEVVSGSSVRYHVAGKGIGSSNTVIGHAAIRPRDGGSRVHWTVDITELGGLLKAIPQGLLKGAAQKVIDDIWANIASRLASA